MDTALRSISASNCRITATQKRVFSTEDLSAEDNEAHSFIQELQTKCLTIVFISISCPELIPLFAVHFFDIVYSGERYSASYFSFFGLSNGLFTPSSLSIASLLKAKTDFIVTN